MANMMECGAMECTMSVERILGLETPMNTSAPSSVSTSPPDIARGFERSVMFSLKVFILSRPRATIPLLSTRMMS